MDPGLAARLGTPRLRELIDRERPYDPKGVLAARARLAAEGLDPLDAAAVLTQARLRDRARGKLGPRADRLLLTAEGLEQATRADVADRHAQRLRATGARTVWDIGCGLGSDALALAEAGLRVLAVDRDPATARLAQANLRGYDAAVVVTQAERLGLTGDTARIALWCDPARRLPGRGTASGGAVRVRDLESLSPAWSVVRELAGAAAAAGVKLAPGFAPTQIPTGVEAQWTSVDGVAVECCLWWGSAARTTARSAQVRTANGWEVLTDDADGDETDDGVQGEPGGGPGRWLVEPDPGVLAAGLGPRLARLVGAGPLDDAGGYLTAAAAVLTPFARCWEVVAELPWSLRAVRSWARSARVGRLTVKRRGPRFDVERWRRDLRLSGPEEAVVVVVDVAGRRRVLVLDRPDLSRAAPAPRSGR